jgi:hypothetical protein
MSSPPCLMSCCVLPHTYLGLVLSPTKLSIATLDSLVVKAERSIPGWHTKLRWC